MIDKGSEKIRIGWGQLLILLLLCKVFTLMTYVPLIGEGYSLTSQLIAAVISIVIQAIMIIPIIILNKCVPEKNVTLAAFSVNKGLGIIYSVLYFAYFIIYASNSTFSFQRFITIRFYPSVNKYLWVAIFIIVCVYCAYLGIEGISRSSVLVFLLFIFMLILMVLMSIHDIDFNNYYFDRNFSDSIYTAVLNDIQRNGEITALAFLMKFVSDKFRCSAYGYLAAKLVTVEIVTLLIITVLGDFAAVTEYPFMEVGSYSGVRLIQRLDSVYMVTWTITSVINISLFIYLCGNIIKEVFPKIKYANSISGLIIFMLCIPLVLQSEKNSIISALFSSGYSVIFYTAVLPLILLIILKISAKKHKEKA